MATFLSSTAVMMNDMFRATRDVPKTVKTSDIQPLIKMERDFAQVSAGLSHSTPLMSSINDIEAGLNQLRNNQATVALESSFAPSFTAYNLGAKEITHKRDELVQVKDKNLAEFGEKIPAVLKELEENNPQKADVIVRELERSESNLVKDAEQLVRNESHLQEKLKDLHNKVFEAVPAQERSGLTPPPSPGEKAQP